MYYKITNIRDLISLNKAGNRKRGRPKRPATATSEMSKTSDSPEKKKKKEIKLGPKPVIRKKTKMSKRV